jgi:hypothetical protein
MKAYDSVSWEFILHCLGCFGASIKFVGWVRECISSPSGWLLSRAERLEAGGSHVPQFVRYDYGDFIPVVGRGCD